MKNGSQKHPQQRGQPAPKNRNRRADDRAGTGNTGKMVSKNDLFSGRQVIDIVPKLLTRYAGRRIKTKDFSRNPPSVCVVSDQIADQGTNGNQDGGHAQGLPVTSQNYDSRPENNRQAHNLHSTVDDNRSVPIMTASDTGATTC